MLLNRPEHLNNAQATAGQATSLQATLTAQITALSTMTEGTDNSKRAVQDILNQTPALKAMGITTASSFNQIQAAANGAIGSLGQLTKAELRACSSGSSTRHE